jgi:glutathione peroxidase
MTVKQRFLKMVYPAFLIIKKLGNKKKVLNNQHNTKPSFPIYEYVVRLINGQQLPLKEFIGKKMLIVNTASDCGYTPQYEQLQQLYDSKKDKLVVIGFPSNDFKEQEKASESEIEQFCKINYGVQFPLTEKVKVVKEDDQHPVFKWLSDQHLNGWNHKQPPWNFSKYLINENGELTHCFAPDVSPLSEEVLKAIEQ